ncbi:MAG: hypothetical protein QOJ94_1450 [Sphingomonadales bacterium]|jgi:hypothetical protein|nr:hypothetical protein [Sphingomonadales bacterium]
MTLADVRNCRRAIWAAPLTFSWAVAAAVRAARTGEARFLRKALFYLVGTAAALLAVGTAFFQLH